MHVPRPLVVAAAVPFYRLGLNHRVHPRIARRVLDASAALMPLPAGVSVERVTLAGRPCDRTTAAAGDTAILYLHGGGYTVGSPRLYRNLGACLARSSGATVWNFDYRLAPEHPYPAALDDAVAAVHALIDEHGYAPSRIAIAGDSAGGGLTVATARRLADAGVHVAALGLISPWTDPSDSTGMARRSRGTDREWGNSAAVMYRGAAAHDDPGYAPLHGRLGGLPPMFVHASPSELLYDQIRRFVDKARAAGVDVTVAESRSWWHSFHVTATTLRDATEAVDDLGHELANQLSRDPARKS